MDVILSGITSQVCAVFHNNFPVVNSHLFNKMLTESWSDPFSGMNPTVHPNGFLWCGAVEADLHIRFKQMNKKVL